MLELRILRFRWPRARLLACLLVLFASGCVTTPPLTRGSTAQVQDKRRGPEIIIIKDGRTHYFENRLPHCLAYTLTGEWNFATQEAALGTPDGRYFVGVRLSGSETMSGAPGAEPVSRAVAYFQADAEKDWGRSIPNTVKPFPASRGGAVLLQFGEVAVTPEVAARLRGPEKPKGGQIVEIQKRVIVPFLPEVVMVVTVSDVTHARQVLDTLEVTEHPRCWEATIRERFPGVLR